MYLQQAIPTYFRNQCICNGLAMKYLVNSGSVTITKAILELIRELKKEFLSVLSGDNMAEQENLQKLMGSNVTLLFTRTRGQVELYPVFAGKGESNDDRWPHDAGALKQSDIGIAVAEQPTISPFQ